MPKTSGQATLPNRGEERAAGFSSTRRGGPVDFPLDRAAGRVYKSGSCRYFGAGRIILRRDHHVATDVPRVVDCHWIDTAGGAGRAQSPANNTASAAAAVTVRPMPTKLRVQIELRSYGKTPEVALQNLAARRAAAIARLKQLKADAASIAFGIPRVEPATPAGYSGPTTGVAPGYAGPAYSSPAPAAPGLPTASGWAAPRPTDGPVPAPKPATKRAVLRLYLASGTLRADWRLEAGDPDQLAAVAARIRDNAKAADLAGAAAAEKLSPEEQEAIEELEMGMTTPGPIPYGGTYFPPGSTPPTVTSGPAPGGPPSRSPVPTFIFVATLSAAERKAAIAKAFTLAKRDVENLAEAAGMKLGTIARLEPPSIAGALVNPQSAPPAGWMEGGHPPLETYKTEDEAMGADANETAFTVAVSLTCHLLPAAAGR